MIEVYDDVRNFGGEVGGRVVEGEVGILPDTGETKVDRTGGDAVVQSLQFGIQVLGVIVDGNELGPGRKLADETLAQVLPGEERDLQEPSGVRICT